MLLRLVGLCAGSHHAACYILTDAGCLCCRRRRRARYGPCRAEEHHRYCTGLDIGWTTRDEATRAFGQVKDQADREGQIRLASKPLCDYLVLVALEIANRQEMPIQFHTGFGDTDINLLKANPLHLRPLLESEKFRKVRFVLLDARVSLRARTGLSRGHVSPCLYGSLTGDPVYHDRNSCR